MDTNYPGTLIMKDVSAMGRSTDKKRDLPISVKHWEVIEFTINDVSIKPEYITSVNVRGIDIAVHSPVVAPITIQKIILTLNIPVSTWEYILGLEADDILYSMILVPDGHAYPVYILPSSGTLSSRDAKMVTGI